MVFTLLIENGLSIVRLPKRLDGTNSSLAAEEIPSLLETNLPIIFDASSCTFITSAGLRLLLITAKQSKSLGLPIIISGLADNLIDIMSITGFDHIFAFTKDLDEAVNVIKD